MALILEDINLFLTLSSKIRPFSGRKYPAIVPIIVEDREPHLDTESFIPRQSNPINTTNKAKPRKKSIIKKEQNFIQQKAEYDIFTDDCACGHHKYSHGPGCGECSCRRFLP